MRFTATKPTILIPMMGLRSDQFEPRPTMVTQSFDSVRYEPIDGLLYAVTTDGMMHHKFDLVHGYEFIDAREPGALFVIDEFYLPLLQTEYGIEPWTLPLEESGVPEGDTPC